MTQPELRDKDQAVLHTINEGENDTQKIKEATTLENHEIRYCLEKLEKHQLIKITRPEGMVERIVDGQKRVFQHPKQAQLTEQGEQYLRETERDNIDEYDDLSHNEVVERVHRLEKQIEGLEKKFEVFRDQIQQHLN